MAVVRSQCAFYVLPLWGCCVQEGTCEDAPVWTPGFQAPGWEGKVSQWSDWYALGVCIDKLLVRTSVHVCFEMGLPVVSAA